AILVPAHVSVLSPAFAGRGAPPSPSYECTHVPGSRTADHDRRSIRDPRDPRDPLDSDTSDSHLGFGIYILRKRLYVAHFDNGQDFPRFTLNRRRGSCIHVRHAPDGDRMVELGWTAAGKRAEAEPPGCRTRSSGPHYAARAVDGHVTDRP